MDSETMICELKSIEEKHKHDKVFTGQLNIAEMACNVRKNLKNLNLTRTPDSPRLRSGS